MRDESGKNVPMIICGDFNSLPDSGVNEFLTHGHVQEDHAGTKLPRSLVCTDCYLFLITHSPTCSDFDMREYGSFVRDGIRHDFNFKSACSALPFTNYTWGTPTIAAATC